MATPIYDYGMVDDERRSRIDNALAKAVKLILDAQKLPDGRVVSNFCVAALRGENLEIYGDGNSTRSFAYVDDIIDALARFGAGLPASGEMVIA